MRIDKDMLPYLHIAGDRTSWQYDWAAPDLDGIAKDGAGMYYRCEPRAYQLFDSRDDPLPHLGTSHRNDKPNAGVGGKSSEILMDRNAIDNSWAHEIRIHEKSQALDLHARTLLIAYALQHLASKSTCTKDHDSCRHKL